MSPTVLEIADKLNSLLEENGRIVVTAPPGAGKSTVLPLSILKVFKDKGKIIMLEPRRLAAKCIAERMASQLGERPGETVGYRTRFESRISTATSIEVVTERILVRMMADDPTLEGIACLIFDEFHERSLDSDLALAMALNCQNIIRPDLRLLLMSATIDTSQICGKLGARLLECSGRMFPVDIRYSRLGVGAAIREALNSEDGSILVFLPGEAEIRRCCEELSGIDGSETRGSRIAVMPLYGMLGPKEQQEAISPAPAGTRKIVLSTPIAETSLTIEGVTTVIDSGLYRKPVFSARTSMSRLETLPISLDMATQRSGRAGRTAPGVCWRLWDKGAESSMKKSRDPEILSCDLSSAVLDIAASGESKPMELPWLTPPPAKAVAEATALIESLGAIDNEGKITKFGTRMAAIPAHPRIASMLLSAATPQEKSLACVIAALIGEKDPLSEEPSADFCLRLKAFARSGSADRTFSRIRKIADQYMGTVKANACDLTDFSWETAGKLLSRAYPERIAKRLSSGRYLLANSRTAFLEPYDPLDACGYLVIVSMSDKALGDGKIFLASGISEDDLEPLADIRRRTGWNSREGCAQAVIEARIGSVVLWQKQAGDVPPHEIVNAVCDAAPKEGLTMFNFDDSVSNLQRRIAAAKAWHPELGLPDVSTRALLDSAPEWLPMYIGKATKVNELRKIDICKAIWDRLDYSQQQEVERIAPSHISVPTGSRIKLEYRQGAELPVLRVRLQECFGMPDSPRVDGGRVKVLMDLLSPGFKSVQLTSDLASFWSATYFEVRKELRMRYPKHSWPENPLEAEAVRGAVRKKK